jgi:hypothetical protein
VATFRSLPLRRRQDNASNAHLSLAFAHVWRGQARIIVEVEARACPLRQVQKTHGGVGVLPYLLPSTTLIAHERRLSLSHFLDNALHFLNNASYFLEDHQSLSCVICALG